MIKLSERTLDWVYEWDSPEFNECKHCIILRCADKPIVYGLGFNPQDLSAELEHDPELEHWHWPNNQMAIDVVSALTIHHKTEDWNFFKKI